MSHALSELKQRVNQLELLTTQLTVREPSILGPGEFYAVVMSVGDDVLTCRRYSPATLLKDAVTDTNDFYVAKPDLLRRTDFDGTTQNNRSFVYTNGYERAVTEGAVTENQEIVPAYDVVDVNKIIVKSFETGVYVDNKPIRFLDMNNDGRYWGAV